MSELLLLILAFIFIFTPDTYIGSKYWLSVYLICNNRYRPWKTHIGRPLGCTIACLKLSGNTPFIKELFMIAKGVGLVVSKASLNRSPGNTSDWQNVNFFWEIILSNWDEDTGCKFVKLLDEWTRWEWSKSKGERCDLISCTFWT